MGRTTFTNITPLPPTLSRELVLEFLHDHLEMIDLNPLIIERHTIPPPPHAAPEEHRCVWYSLTDRISYLPGVSGKLTYTCAFNDMPDGIQTHCFAPMGLDIRDRWSVAGSLPGEPPQPVEIGLNAPPTGLYIREDVDLRCNSMMISFVRKTINKAHLSLVDRLAEKAQMRSTNNSRLSLPASSYSYQSSSAPPSLGSGSLAVSPIGPLLPSSPSNYPQDTLPVPYSSPAQQLPSYQQTQQHTSRPNGHAYGSHNLMVPPQNYNGGLRPPGIDVGGKPKQGGLSYSGTVYHGNSKPQDYVEFSAMNPYEKMDPTLDQEKIPETKDMYPPPLRVSQERRVKPTELE